MLSDTFCSCSSYFSRDHLDLHSFPTRRSSDLGRTTTGPAKGESVSATVVTATAVAGAATTTRTTTPSRRSEEHTSELQSRGHLVCRLLLEKKKKTTRRAWTQ